MRERVIAVVVVVTLIVIVIFSRRQVSELSIRCAHLDQVLDEEKWSHGVANEIAYRRAEQIHELRMELETAQRKNNRLEHEAGFEIVRARKQ